MYVKLTRFSVDNRTGCRPLWDLCIVEGAGPLENMAV